MGALCSTPEAAFVGDWDVLATNPATKTTRKYTVYIMDEEDHQEHFEGDETGVLEDLAVADDHEFTAEVRFDDWPTAYEMKGKYDPKNHEVTSSITRPDGTWNWVWKSAASGDKAGGDVKTRGGGGKMFQWKSGHGWNDYDKQEHAILMRSFMSGHKKAKFHCRGSDYEYDYKKMKQLNKDSGRTRE